MENSVRSFIVVVLVGLMFVLALLFGAKNEQVVTLSYFIAEGQYRLPMVLAVVFFSGFIISVKVTKRLKSSPLRMQPV
jgi:putative membrane protein